MILYTSVLRSSHGTLNFHQCGENLFIILSPANNLQTDWCIDVLLWAVHLIHESILVVFGYIARILDVLLLVDGGDGEDNGRVVQEVPLRSVAPVPRLLERSSSSE
jgi:hypothetical protein